ncbi:sugar ABC transporter substrate-binding protein [Jeotgalibacillus proteolyticus]|uniref:Sugar ABC transporter substrate-binding protein n=1 Tax=Jeotgalibacillus proteolyticus TaxID=2082395 RepID=A0A2S5G8M5_9BACL|nr:substrate-binding domain-containing protein [Jeotgalibacillus proteolyticus]PPA69357.1 sugar ABC transporter substrate-binding protein [Jeotgalibacillus proteolyticus]
MRKIVALMAAGLGGFLFYSTFQAAGAVFYTNWHLPAESKESPDRPRVAFIMNEMDHPFWVEVIAGAEEQAEIAGVDLDVTGIYGTNRDDFLRKIEIAIYSKVDGIIVQGLDHEKFKELTKLKAASYGIPIITVAHDVPKEESLRKTYVGSNQFSAGEQLAAQLIEDMGPEGEVVLMMNAEQEYFQQQRLDGIKNYLNGHSEIETIEAKIGADSNPDISAISDLLNYYPETEAYIAVNAAFTQNLVTEIETRSKVDPYYLYTFDEEREAYALLESGKIDGIVEQSPQEMGKISVQRMKEWLDKENVPLDIEGYFTETRIIKDAAPQ